MVATSLLPLLVLAIPFASSQTGFYGPVTTRPHSGDPAPNLTFAKVLSSPGNAAWKQSNLSGQLTVLAFFPFPITSRNLDMENQWNAVVDKFKGKPVQFVWIVGGSESTLLPWLLQHPFKGWVLYDPQGKSGNAYGMELPADVIIGKDGKIIGFFDGIPEVENIVQASQEGRVTTTPPSPATFQKFNESRMVLVDSEAPRMPRPDDHRPAFPPSYALHVSPSQRVGSGSFGSDDFYALEGVSLKDAIISLYGVNSIRIQIPPSLEDGERYDFSLVLPKPESSEQIKARMRKGIQDYFHVNIGRENQLVDVYVLTVAQGGKLSAVKPQSGGGIVASSVGYQSLRGGIDDAFAGTKPQPIGAIRSVSTDGGTVDSFCSSLESALDRPVVNETNIQGEFKIHVDGGTGADNKFLERLREQLGLVITPAQRKIEIIVVKEVGQHH